MINKVAIIGLPGAGKSTLAQQIKEKLHLPIYHLDSYMFEPGSLGKKRDKRELAVIEQEMTTQDKWIIEGCSLSTLETRFQKADMVIFLKPSRITCLYRIFKRALRPNNELKDTGCYFGFNWRIIKYLWTFEKEKGPGIYSLAKKYPETPFKVIRSLKELRF